ncbi:MAG TPA: nucleotidyl transferase AbiEii/AbiGii toxin family protein [Blastocatellia bacterium]|nr:nucleotidyl transferase AbiEii/AbiGii toxin family protein [Blastocatellia bacterium]
MEALIESDNVIFYEVLDTALDALNRSGATYVLMGGVAATALGGHRFTHDIDVFVKPEDAERVLDALAVAGFETEKTDSSWLYKAFLRNVMVDIIFKSSGPVFLDDEMIERSVTVNFYDRQVRTLSPEDLLVIKALVLNEHSLSLDRHCMRHLNDLLTIIRTSKLDWDYLIRRARFGPKRVLSLLLYAQSLDLLVPDRVIKSLLELLEIC